MSKSYKDVQQSELWEVSRRLVSLNTVSAVSNVQAAEYLADMLEDQGYTIHLQKETVNNVEKANLIAWAGPEVPGGLILSGHMDIVPFEGQPGWRSDPLELRLEDDTIFGRGVSDMKVFLAQAVLAAKRYPVNKLQRPLLFIFTCDEEIASQGAGRLVPELPALFAHFPVPEVALIGEPTDYNIFPAHKGYAMFDVVVHGVGGHSSDPSKGLNAIEKMDDVIHLLRDINNDLQKDILPENKQLFPEVPSSILNLGTIHGGLAPNMIAETCHLTVSVRIAPGNQVEEIITHLRERIEHEIVPAMTSAIPNKSNVGITLENVITAPALHSPTDDAFCHLLSRVMGKSADRGAPYATDGGQFQRIGINSYICGPGLLEQAHQPNESISVRNFVSGQEKLERIIYEWCVEPGEGYLRN
jgi:acetylornithine deacetylase